MYTINVDTGFKPYGEESVHDFSKPFPSGVEANVFLHVGKLPEEVRITMRFSKDNDVMKLLLVTDASHRLGAKKIHLFISYLPYARQDRVTRTGEAFSLKVFTNVLNAQGYESVTVFDPHSDVASALIDHVVVEHNHRFLAKAFEGKSDYILVSPDAGASKKIHLAARAIGYQGLVLQCGKHRVPGGRIDSVEIPNADFSGKDLYIIDDICDGGATFTNLATELKKRNAKSVTLVVSHGIFSKGLEILKQGGIDHVITTDSFKNNEPNAFLTEIKLCETLI